MELPAGRNTQKHNNKQIEAFTFWLKKSPKTAFFMDKNFQQNIILTHCARNRSKIKSISTSGYFELFLFKVSGVIYAPAIRIRIKELYKQILLGNQKS